MNHPFAPRAVDPAAVQRYFTHVAQLPTMPEVASRLLESFNDDNVDLRTLAELIGQDQALTVKLLRMANSARFSPTAPVATIQAAAALIGMRNLRDLAIASCVAGAFPSIPGFNRLAFWRKSLATAGHARVLATLAGIDGDVAYLAGLVMRTGELLMRMVDPAAVAEIDDRSRGQGSRLPHEWDVLACTHVHVTAGLVWRWNFPQALAAGLLASIDPLADEPVSLLGVVLGLASVLAELGESNQALAFNLWQLRPEMVSLLGADLAWLDATLPSHADLVSGVDVMLA